MNTFLILPLVLLQPPAGKDDPQRMLQKERDEKNRLLVLVDVARAELAWDRDDINRVRELMDRHIAAPGAPDYRGPEWHALHAVSRYQLRDFPTDGGGGWRSGHGWQWSPDSRFVATDVQGGRSQQVSINDIRTGEQAGVALEDRDSMWDWSPDGRWFAVSSRTSTVVWDSTTRKARKLLTRAAAREATIYHHAWSPDGKRIACPFGDGSVRVLETATGAETRKLAPAGGAHTARWSPDGKRIAVAGPGGVAAFAADTGKELFAHNVKAAPPITRVLEWSPKGKWLAAAVAAPATGETLLVFDGTTGERKWALTAGHLRGRVVPNWSPLQWPPDDDQHLAWTSDPEGRLFALWDLNTGRSVHRGSRPGDSPFKPKDPAGWIEMLYWAPSGRVVDWSSPIQPPGFTTWSISPPRRLASAVLGREQNPIYTHPLFAFSPNGKRVAVIFPHVHTEPRDGRSFVELLVWDAETGKEVFRSRAFPAGDRIEGLGSITWSPDSKRIVVAGGVHPSGRPPGSKLKVFDGAAAPDPAGGKPQ